MYQEGGLVRVREETRDREATMVVIPPLPFCKFLDRAGILLTGMRSFGSISSSSSNHVHGDSRHADLLALSRGEKAVDLSCSGW